MPWNICEKRQNINKQNSIRAEKVSLPWINCGINICIAILHKGELSLAKSEIFCLMSQSWTPWSFHEIASNLFKTQQYHVKAFVLFFAGAVTVPAWQSRDQTVPQLDGGSSWSPIYNAFLWACNVITHLPLFLSQYLTFCWLQRQAINLDKWLIKQIMIWLMSFRANLTKTYLNCLG